MTLVRFFDEPTTLDEAGGKSVNLSRLTRAGFPVPSGFVVTTDAFRAAVDAHGLRDEVDAALGAANPEDAASVDEASRRVRAAFAGPPAATLLTEPVAQALLDAYRQLGGGAVAVRSSATAEDLPDLSFAGQQDTLLGVTDEDALLAAVVECWSSLWTARAIMYRRRAGIPEEAAALAVAVQRMVPAETSGVLFTANPLTGHRGQMAIDATFGLGEALVSGLVEPDHYIADAATGRVLERTLGAKAVVTSSVAGGGVETRNSDRGSEATLTDADVRALVDLGRRVQDEYGTPQDIEWAIAGGQVALLQARAITSLFPVPAGAPKGAVYLSFGAVQGVLTPITPLGGDAIRCVMAGGARVFGTTLEPETNPWIGSAGERLWIRLDRALRNPVGSRVLPGLLMAVDPSARRILLDLREEGVLAPLPREAMRPVVPKLARFARVAGRNLARAVRDPETIRAEFDEVTEAAVARATATFAATAAEPDPFRRVAARARALRQTLSDAFPTVVPYAGVVIAGPVLALRVLTRLSGATDEGDHGVSPLVLEVTRALPHNVTTEMDLALWQVAQTLRDDPEDRRRAAELSASELADRYASGGLSPTVTAAMDGFLAAYGMRGVGEIDLGRPRWSDDPAEVLATVQRYQDIPEDQSPPAQFGRGEQAAARAIDQLVAQPGGARGRLVGFLAGRIRALAGGRELPKFTIVRMMGVARTALVTSGRDLVEAGVLDSPDDLFLLRLNEIEALADGPTSGLRRLVAERRAALDREARRAQIPRVLVGDGRAFYEGLGKLADDEGVIVGSPVSPGTVEGTVRVVFDPAHSGLRHGEILVCPGTDPAWTPLFLSAAGLVTEVGGMMTHGSVVAREYGIPAVVGVHEATTRLTTGQRVRLDGTSGTVVVLPHEWEVPPDDPAPETAADAERVGAGAGA
ncbi:MAG: PEP/pyruvate-binding domain-containing protein [Lapillicoccus sp.]